MLRYYSIILLSLCQLYGFGQSTDNSIFSRFGLGDIQPQSYTSFQALGGSASGYATTFTINSVNPAFYSKLGTTAFDFGLSARYFRTDLNGEAGNSIWAGHLENVAIAFPLRNAINKSLDPIKKPTDFGMAFGIHQVSRIGYNVSSTELIDGIGQIKREYEGYGGLYKFYWGNSVKYKNFYAGINASYLFGRFTYEKNILFSDILSAFDDYFTTSYNARGFQLDYGLAYSHNFKQSEEVDANNLFGNILTIGVHGMLPTNLKTLADEQNVLIQDFGTVSIASTDTLLNVTEQEGNMKLPTGLGFGISYQQEQNWAVTASFKITPWSQYNNEANPETLQDVRSLQFGAWYTPDYKSYTSYFKRIRYKIGGFYQNEPARIGLENSEDDEVTHYGLTLGTQLPFVNQRKISRADIAVTLGYKGNSIINERYLNIKFGFSFNDDQWFLKRKYN